MHVDPRVRPLGYCVQYRRWRKSPAYNLHCTQVFHAIAGVQNRLSYRDLTQHAGYFMIEVVA